MKAGICFAREYIKDGTGLVDLGRSFLTRS